MGLELARRRWEGEEGGVEKGILWPLFHCGLVGRGRGCNFSRVYHDEFLVWYAQ